MSLTEAPKATCAVVTDTCCDMVPVALERIGVACCSAEPKVVELAELYRELFAQGFEEVVSVHASDVAPIARTAATAVGDTGRVIVIEPKLISAALAIVAERAACAAASGMTGDEVAERASAVAAETVLYVVTDPRAPRQGEGGLRDRLAYLRRRALGTRHLVRNTADGHKVLAESEDLAHLTGKVAQSLGTCSRRKGDLCYIDIAAKDGGTIAQLRKPFDTNEYVSYRISTLIPAPTLARNAGPDAVGVAVIPEAVYGGHTTSLFDKSRTE